MKELVRFVKDIGADLGQLDILVEDIKCQQANQINRKGLEVQITYLLQHRRPEELKDWIRHEMGVLRRYHMRTQSKVIPKNNRRLK